MSAGSPSGAVQIVGELDLRQAYAALYQFRKDASNITIGGTFGASAGVPGASSAFTAATAAFEGGSQRFMTPPGTPATFQAIAGGNFSGPAFTSAAASQMPMMQFGQQIQQLTMAVHQMTAAASRMVGGAMSPAATVAAEESVISGAAGGRGMRMPRTAWSGLARVGSMIGGFPGLGIAMGLEAGREILTQNLSYEHELRMAEMLGKTPTEVAQIKMGQLERIRSGGFLGLNPLIQAGADKLAAAGINPGGLFTRLPEAEKRTAAEIRVQEENQFLGESGQQYRGMRFDAFQNIEPNQNIRARATIARDAAERNLGITERFSIEQSKYPVGSAMYNQLGREMQDILATSNDLRMSADIGQDRTERREGRKFRAGAAHYGLLVQRRGLDAQLSDIQAEYEEASRNAPPGEQFAVGAKFTQQAEYAKQQQKDRTDILQATLGARNRALSIAGLTHPENPALAGALGNISSTYTGALLSAYETSLRNDLDPARKAAIERGQLYTGTLQLQVERQNFKRSLRSDELDSINQSALQGPGTVAAGDYLSQISEAVESLNKIAAMLGTLTPAVQDLIDNSD